MNFLDLCRDAARESGTLAGGGLAVFSTVASASGRAEKIVNWVRQAWISIQLEHNDWLFMRREFQAPLQVGKTRYTGAELGIDRLGVWLPRDDEGYPFTLWDDAVGQQDEADLCPIPYGTWRARYDRGVHDATRPTEMSVSPLNALCVGAKPDKPYVLRGTYVVTPQILTANDDVPEMPAQYHRAIVWEAIKLMAIADEAPTALQTSVGEYARVRDAMSRDMRPRSMISYASDSVIA